MILLGCGDEPRTHGTTFITAEAPPSAAPRTEQDIADVRALTLEYQKAIYANDGDAAVRVVSSRTLGYFEEVRQATRSMPELELKRRPLLFRLMVLMIPTSRS